MNDMTLTLLMACALLLSSGCSGGHASKPPIKLRTTAQCSTVAQKHDPMVVLEAWEVSPQKLAKRHGDDAVVALVATWTQAHVVRLWSVEEGTWFGIIASTPEPSPDTDIVMVSWSSDAAKHPLIHANVRKASDLWPTH